MSFTLKKKKSLTSTFSGTIHNKFTGYSLEICMWQCYTEKKHRGIKNAWKSLYCLCGSSVLEVTSQGIRDVVTQFCLAHPRLELRKGKCL